MELSVTYYSISSGVDVAPVDVGSQRIAESAEPRVMWKFNVFQGATYASGDPCSLSGSVQSTGGRPGSFSLDRSFATHGRLDESSNDVFDQC